MHIQKIPPHTWGSYFFWDSEPGESKSSSCLSRLFRISKSAGLWRPESATQRAAGKEKPKLAADLAGRHPQGSRLRDSIWTPRKVPDSHVALKGWYKKGLGALKLVLGGSCDLVAAYTWAHNPTYNLPNRPHNALQRLPHQQLGFKPSSK